jgi:hypothetical protein
LLPMMVPSLPSRLPSLVGCFRCPPPPILSASHGRRHQQSVTLTAGDSTSPSYWRGSSNTKSQFQYQSLFSTPKCNIVVVISCQ